MKIPKYRNVKTIVDGIKFDSKKEAKRYNELKLLEKCGKISSLKLQPIFKFDSNDRGDEIKYKSGRSLTYRADFSYFKKQENGKLGDFVVEDVKGIKTPEYKIKWALMKYINGIEVVEI